MSNQNMDSMMLELFLTELATHHKALEEGLVEAENSHDPTLLESMMRAAHSIKGAARIVGLPLAVELSHTMEDVFVSAQNGNIELDQGMIDNLLKGSDIFGALSHSKIEELGTDLDSKADEIHNIIALLSGSDSPPDTGASPAGNNTSAITPPPPSHSSEKILPSLKCDPSMYELFRSELEVNTEEIENFLKAYTPGALDTNSELIVRASHSIKGAARIIGMNELTGLAAIMEEMTTALMNGARPLSPEDIEMLHSANDILSSLAGHDYDSIGAVISENMEMISQAETNLKNAMAETNHQKESTKDKNQTVSQSNNMIMAPAPPENNEIFADLSLLDLFITELNEHTKVLERGLVEVEADQTPGKIEPLMRAAHSIKGAARIVGLPKAVDLAHSMEDILSAAQNGGRILDSNIIDLLLKGNDIFLNLSKTTPEQLSEQLSNSSEAIAELIKELSSSVPGPAPVNIKNDAKEILPRQQAVKAPAKPIKKFTPPRPDNIPKPATDAPAKAQEQSAEESFVRVMTTNLNKLMGLSGESLVLARGLNSFSDPMQKIKKTIIELDSARENLTAMSQELEVCSSMSVGIEKTGQLIDTLHSTFNSHIEKFELFSRRMELVTEKLYNEAIETRMKTFSEGLHGFRRMVRDVAKELNKKVNLVFEGLDTKVDRDILDSLEAPLNHLIRNAVDHGLEHPEQRVASGKEPTGTLTVHAGHRSGMLVISVSDDGKGIDKERLKDKILAKGLTNVDMLGSMSDTELMDFLFLPGFSTTSEVTRISGRGVGLDIVFSMVSKVGGSVSVESELGQGTSFKLQLPLTLSVMRTLLVEISDELYAMALTKLDRILYINSVDIFTNGEKQYYQYNGQNIGLIQAGQVLGLEVPESGSDFINIAVISDRLNVYGIVVDKILSEKELVVHPLDKRLGKVPNISAGAILEDGSPILILDIEDMVRSIDSLLTGGILKNLPAGEEGKKAKPKHILVVDDSLTVREVERKLLENSGYDVTLAVDGMDGWNKMNQGKFDMVISDIDMPRMNGIELVSRIKQDHRYKAVPVMIVSYKDSEENKLAGLQAGANYYLTKSSFHDESLINIVSDLIGEAQ